ncbi:MAG TPA: hypothetical protein VLC91_11685 [Spongiibacteraceae bacterium]|nr:hypothetical protein [Spongiibacteraceae bacterium]
MTTAIETKLKDNIHERTDAAAQAVHAMVDRVAKRAEVSEEKLRDSAEQAQQKLQKSMRKARVKSVNARNSITDFMRRHPVASIGIAVGIGALLAARGKRTNIESSHGADGATERDETAVH